MTDPTPAPDRREVVDEIRQLLSSLENLVPGSSADAGTAFTLAPIGVVESTLRSLEGAPRQGSEGAPDAWIEVQPKYADGLAGIQAGDALLVLTWLHRADRATLQVHPRDDLQKPLTGVFRTRSADRPNPIGIHPVTVREIHGSRLLVGPLEALHGTPVLDLKPVL